MKELRRSGKFAMLQTPGTYEIITINASSGIEKIAGGMGGIAHFGFRLREPVESEKILERVVQLGGNAVDKVARRLPVR